MVTINVCGAQLKIYWVKERVNVLTIDHSPSKFNQHFASIDAQLGTKFNDSSPLSWNLPESIPEFKFISADAELVEK